MPVEHSPETKEFLRGLTITLDMDGVLAWSAVSVINKFNRMYNTKYFAWDIKGWDGITKLAEGLGEDPQIAFELETFLWYDPELLLAAPPMPGARALTRLLHESGAGFSIITSRKPNAGDITFEWFRRWMPWINHEQIFIRRDENMSGEVFKAQTVAAREANFHVDDSPRHAQFVLDYTQANTNIFLLSNNPGELQYNPRVFAIKVLMPSLRM